jgi:propanol-preferring alcohol dehydrogenase
LGIQYARAMGCVTVAISTSNSKEELAKQLGAHHYIDTSKQDPVAELQKLGGAKVILATGYDSKSQSALIRMYHHCASFLRLFHHLGYQSPN